MNVLEILEDFFEPLIKNTKDVLIQSFKVWVFMPVAIFVLYSFWLIIFGINEDGITKLFLLATNAGLEWWISIIMNLKKVLAEYLLSLLIVLGYDYFN